MFEKTTAAETARALDADPARGLSRADAERRLMENGKNALTEKKPKTVLQMFLEQLNEPMIYILLAAAVISLFLREFGDAVIVLVVIILNAVIGVVQEGKAQQALAALKKLSSPTALVRREGEVREIPAQDLVLGDLVVLEAGRQVPADLRLTFSTNLKIEESALTGESVPVEKDASFTAADDLPLGDRLNMAYMTTSVTYGRGEGIVIAAGMDTEIGRIARMIDDAPEEQTPLQKRLADLGKLLGIIAIALCVLLFVIAVIQKRDVVEMLITAISLAVAAVPEGLPAVVTIVLALGVQRLVKVNTIVRRLPSVETLGAVSVVCSDKTGTLTQNKMTVVRCYANGASFDVKELDPAAHAAFLNGFMLCNDALIEGERALGDPTEIALLEMGRLHGLDKRALERDTPRVDELPFDSGRKMMTTQHACAGSRIAYTKGAADQLLRRCERISLNGTVRPITEGDVEAVNAAVGEMSANALRVLALASRDGEGKPVEEKLTFLGLVGMIDPPRPEAAEAVRIFKQAKVRTVMITGDHRDTAFAIAKELGIARNLGECVTGEELDRMTVDELSARADDICVFARVSPEHKVMIVNALRARGYIVSMTGDGVNDAPSLKAADIGVAMGITGTDVAKSAADMVLTDDNFATIEKAIEEGRGIYANIRKSVLFLLSSNFGEIITMFLSILAGLAAPLRAIHILWVNLITDSLPALALGVDPNDRRYIMKLPPRDPGESLFAKGGFALTFFYGALIGLITLGAFLAVPVRALVEAGDAVTLASVIGAFANEALLSRAQTFAFTVLGVSQLFHAVGMRNVDVSVFRMNHAANKMMVLAFVVGLALQVAVTEVPFLVRVFATTQLELSEWLALVAVSTVPLWAHEVICLFRGRRGKAA
ncbi:MAG: Calcium-transporting ATPase 1 [Firmicutes bacterium ADurb.Bin248]|nr:MAG: Calcium-transporting ATPase 1 [Firmicutes bacterium ADurb.Bin248]HOF99954.1 cation-translocating P-type ATPase [Clostridia bacterium]HPK14451.1 cation-translocating P-type ATPase [Clostridia bacterium]